MQKIIIIGASTGIGKALAERYIEQGCQVAITGRRTNLLEEIKTQYPQGNVSVYAMDVAKTEESVQTLNQIFADLGGADILILNAGVGLPKADLETQLYTIDINARGFLALAYTAYEYFREQGKGKIAGISSVAAVRSSPYAPEYHASKAFISRYMEGLRLRSSKWKHGVNVIDIRPGFVDTAMTKSNKTMFWVATPEKAAKQIDEAIQANKKVAYITRRYWLAATFMKIVPESILSRVL